MDNTTEGQATINFKFIIHMEQDFLKNSNILTFVKNSNHWMDTLLQGSAAGWRKATVYYASAAQHIKVRADCMLSSKKKKKSPS